MAVKNTTTKSITFGAISLVLVITVVALLVNINRSADISYVDAPTRLSDNLVITGNNLQPFSPDAQQRNLAPQVRGLNIDNGEVTLLSSSQKTLVVFLSSSCSDCAQQLLELNALVNTLKSDNVALRIVLSSSSSQDNSWLEAQGWRGFTLVDSSGSVVAQAYGSTELPFFTFVDTDGTVLFQRQGLSHFRDIVSLTRSFN